MHGLTIDLVPGSENETLRPHGDETQTEDELNGSRVALVENGRQDDAEVTNGLRIVRNGPQKEAEAAGVVPESPTVARQSCSWSTGAPLRWNAVQIVEWTGAAPAEKELGLAIDAIPWSEKHMLEKAAEAEAESEGGDIRVSMDESFGRENAMATVESVLHAFDDAEVDGRSEIEIVRAVLASYGQSVSAPLDSRAVGAVVSFLRRLRGAKTTALEEGLSHAEVKGLIEMLSSEVESRRSGWRMHMELHNLFKDVDGARSIVAKLDVDLFTPSQGSPDSISAGKEHFPEGHAFLFSFSYEPTKRRSHSVARHTFSLTTVSSLMMLYAHLGWTKRCLDLFEVIRSAVGGGRSNAKAHRAVMEALYRSGDYTNVLRWHARFLADCSSGAMIWGIGMKLRFDVGTREMVGGDWGDGEADREAERDIGVFWPAIRARIARGELDEACRCLLDEMGGVGCMPDEAMVRAVMKALVKGRRRADATALFRRVMMRYGKVRAGKVSYFEPDASGEVSHMDVSGMSEDSAQFFSPDPLCWITYIEACQAGGRGSRADIQRAEEAFADVVKEVWETTEFCHGKYTREMLDRMLEALMVVYLDVKDRKGAVEVYHLFQHLVNEPGGAKKSLSAIRLISLSDTAREIEVEIVTMLSTSERLPQRFIRTVNLALRSMALYGFVREVERVYGLARQSGLKLTRETHAALLEVYVRSNRMADARSLISDMLTAGLIPSVEMFNMVLRGYLTGFSRNTASDERYKRWRFRARFNSNGAEWALKQMRTYGVKPSIETFNVMLTGLTSLGDVATAMELFDCMPHEPDIVSYNIIMHALAPDRSDREAGNEGNLTKMQEVRTLFQRLVDGSEKKASGERGHRHSRSKGRNAAELKPDVVGFTTLMNAYARGDAYPNTDEINKLFAEMIGKGVIPDVICLSVLMLCCVRSGRKREAVDIYRMMVITFRLRPDLKTLTILWMALPGSEYTLESELTAHNSLPVPKMGTTFLASTGDLYRPATSGDLRDRVGTDDFMPIRYELVEMAPRGVRKAMTMLDIKPDLIGYGMLMTSLARLRDGKTAVEMLAVMVEDGVKPNGRVCGAVLLACRWDVDAFAKALELFVRHCGGDDSWTRDDEVRREFRVKEVTIERLEGGWVIRMTNREIWVADRA
ncbi:hypothetical protein HK101_011752 [Irineochytrium annulatum]|nr:hypothetical protein HK101_011752 [Irineochytrium annulatum]